MNVLIIGQGEMGEPLAKLVSKYHDVTTYDIAYDKQLQQETYDVVHLCIPYSEKFVGIVVDYINFLSTSKIFIIESTVLPGTTRALSEKVDLDKVLLCHSPVRGRLADGFDWALSTYTKFIGGINEESSKLAEAYYKTLGMRTRICGKPEDTEWMKILETTYWGLLVAWHQEIERISDVYNLDTKEILNFFKTVETEGHIPRPVLWIGPIGGHCIIPNSELLLQKYDSKFARAIIDSKGTFEKQMKFIDNLGEDKGCPLCNRVYTRKIYRDIPTEPFFIIQCLTCREPMLVFRSHTKPVEEQTKQAINISKELFPNAFLDTVTKSIPKHTHFHMFSQQIQPLE